MSASHVTEEMLDAAEEAFNGVYDVETHPCGGMSDNKRAALKAAIEAVLIPPGCIAATRITMSELRARIANEPVYLLYKGGRLELRTADPAVALSHFRGAGRVVIVAQDHEYQAQRESDFPSAAHAKE